MNNFDHEKLDVYQTAMEFIILIESVIGDLPRGRAYLADQLQRAGSSIPLNIAECAGILHICQQLRLVNEDLYSKSRELLIRIVAMLTKMAKVLG